MANAKPVEDRASAGHAVSPPREVVEPGASPPRLEIQVDDARALTCYANFCRVTGTPEELILDFGLNPLPTGIPAEPVVITQRVVCNLYTAKRLAHVLHVTIQRHEATFGVLETDIQRRVRRM